MSRHQIASWGRLALGLAILAAELGCDPPTEVDSSMEMTAPPPVVTKTPPAPPPPVPVPTKNYYNPAAAQAALLPHFQVSADFAGDADAITKYATLAETLLPVLTADGQRQPAALDDQPLEALRTSLHLLNSEDPSLRDGAHSVLLSVLDKLWAQSLATGVQPGQFNVDQLARVLKQRQQWGDANPAQVDAVIEWMIAHAYVQQPPAAPGTIRPPESVSLSAEVYNAAARNESADQHRQQAWQHVQDGLASNLQPGDAGVAPTISFHLTGDPTELSPKLKMELVNPSDVDHSLCIASTTRLSSGGFVRDAVVVRHLPARSAVGLAEGSIDDFTTKLSVTLNCWSAHGGFEGTRGFRLGRFLTLPPLERGEPKRTSLVSLLVPADSESVQLSLATTAVKPDVLFGVRKATNRENSWYVMMKKANEDAASVVALIELDDDELFFTWNTKAPPEAEQLAQSMLDITRGDVSRRIFFWRPDVAEPIALDMNQGEHVLEVDIDDVVDKRSLVLHTLRLEDSPLVVAGEATFGKWVEIRFRELSLAVIKVRLKQDSDEPFAVVVKPVIDYRGEEGELTAPALEKMYARNLELLNTLPPKLVVANARVEKLQRAVRSLLASGNATSKARAIQAQVALKDETKRRDGLVTALQKAKDRATWTLKASELVKAIHQKKLHFMVTTTGEDRQLVAASDPQILDSGPMYLANAQQGAQ